VAFKLKSVELKVIMLTVMAPCSMLENDGRLAFLQHKRKTADNQYFRLFLFRQRAAPQTPLRK
jgi:hypothetical protein